MIRPWWGAVTRAVTALLLAWIVLVAALAVARPRDERLTEVLRILPDVLRLLHRPTADRTLPGGVRIGLHRAARCGST